MSKFSDRTSKAKKGVKRFFRNLLIIIVILFIGLMFFFYYASYGSGVRAGIVMKVSEKGAIFKTREGQLDLMSFGATKSSNRLSQTFEFSVYKDDDSTYQKLQEVSLTGERVQLDYEEKYVVLPWRGDTKYFITAVKQAPKPKFKENEPDFE